MSSESQQTLRATQPALLAALLAMALYGLTLAGSVGWHDSAELALTAWLPAASHAPGSPLHSLLGFVFARIASEPHTGTTVLSFVSAGLGVAVLAALIYLLCRDRCIAVLGALVYALSFQVWANAVITEVYSLGALLLGCCLLAAYRWQSTGGNVAFQTMLVFYGLAVAAYLANILLWPAFAWFVYKSAKRPVRGLLVFIGATGVAGLLIVAANFLLAQYAFPFGAFKPDSIVGLWNYMSGAQHDPLDVTKSGGVLLRLVEHAGIFSKSLAWAAVPLGLWGLWLTFRRLGHFAGLLLAVFAIYMLYYTAFGSGDYFLMVAPAYLVFAVWAAVGASQLPGGWVSAWAALAIVVLTLTVQQFQGRRAMAANNDAEEFAAATSSALPAEAVAITGWRELTTLVYFQEVHGERADVRFVLPARTLRYYSHGTVADYVGLVRDVICEYPVYTTKELTDLGEEYRMTDVGADPWRQVQLKDSAQGGC